jgi:hypothetical protein
MRISKFAGGPANGGATIQWVNRFIHEMNLKKKKIGNYKSWEVDATLPLEKAYDADHR